MKRKPERMGTGSAEFALLKAAFDGQTGIQSGQMFGKPCLKVAAKAFVAQQNDVLAFKLSGQDHGVAMAVPGAVLWDPSGKGRPMKEWVAIPSSENAGFRRFAEAALIYVRV